MPQRNSTPVTWRPKGLSDALDASDSFDGAMASLQNLIPDPTTARLWQCRPASISLVNFTISGGGFISCYRIVGSFIYGMIASTLNPGRDQPFCYNILTQAMVTVTGTQNATTTPLSPATSGAWTPPSMDVIGAKLIVCHPGFNGVGNVWFGWFDISTPGSPVWNAGNLTGLVNFTIAPTFVRQFNGRAYYIHNLVAQPAVIFSDVLNATNATNANQVLTFGDTLALTALGQLGLQQTQIGGIVQSLIVFKGVSNVYQITGDSALSTLSINSLNVTTGTIAPNSVVATPKGLAFVAPDGIRTLDFDANISDPLGVDGQGATVPFIFAVQPSRICAACTGSILRVSVQNANAVNAPSQEYWYDYSRNLFHGPHTFASSLIQSYSNTFIKTAIGVNNALFTSDPVQTPTSTYVENGTQLAWQWSTCLLPDTDQLTNNSMTEATLDAQLSASAGSVNVAAVSELGGVLDTVQITTTGSATIWGAFTWGATTWAGTPQQLQPYQLNWHQPIVFPRMSIQASGTSASGIRVGALHMRYQQLGYVTNVQAAAA